MTTVDDLLSLCKALNDNKVKYILIGGWAVILHGLVRTTMDIDIIVESSHENIKNLKKAFLRFIKQEEIEELTPEVTEKYQVVRVGLDKFYVDIITKIAGIDYKKAKKDLMIEEIDNIEIPVAGINTMIDLKKGLREVDKKDLLFLKGKKEFLNKK